MASNTASTAKKTATKTAKTLAHKTVAAKKTVVKAVSKPKSKAPAAKTRLHPPAKTATLKQVATQGRRKVSSVVHLTRDASLKLVDSQRAIWLAGLGALAKVTTSTGTKGEKAFEALVKAGEKIESQARGTIDSNADMLKHRINDASRVVDDSINSVSDAFDARVKQALARLGYPKNSKTTK
ncbi:MAG: phasin family protein [Rhodoferax sp.]|uniref:phasin family protein n=1 Tax=Rhodoferax sp. TaxID=50421 RepID=UPI0014010FBF|nr:phasin family protein [Rhodoferax sp.]NDP39155.1 phasin family protein [Rhodoferax sp.]